jgi:hypothetical protein
MCFGFRFTVVMYRGHIPAERENIFDIADIDGNRRGGQDFFTPYIFQSFEYQSNQKST